ncbi:hypothetical protein [Erythrobacter sp. SD-21]|uniref:hypothetical protein n=1 Tax=Erythrobacter sp. SD-21 TaxID=161528 RepID=UPI000153FBA1|nr:hypothetical protein [Erythrobacter sp. SD-21]EDL47916.1 hypothetical protein ED21_25257 [Erythrobacter sp. SD-21]
MSDRISSFTASLRALAERRRRWRMPLLLAGLVLFVVGCVISIRDLGIAPQDIDGKALAILLALLAPLGLAYAATNMLVTAKAAEVEMNFGQAFRVASFAQLAEVLPLPGGAIVRTAALVKGGATTTHSASHVFANALVWIACAAIAAGLSLLSLGWVPALLALGGLVIAIGATGWLAWHAGPALAMLSLVLRILGLLLVAVRLFFAFAALQLAVGFDETLVFAFASIAGSASSIAPAGLGISEAFAAILSQATSTVPAAAFIAVGLNRLISLLMAALASGIFTLAATGAPETAE